MRNNVCIINHPIRYMSTAPMEQAIYVLYKVDITIASRWQSHYKTQHVGLVTFLDESSSLTVRSLKMSLKHWPWRINVKYADFTCINLVLGKHSLFCALYLTANSSLNSRFIVLHNTSILTWASVRYIEYIET